MLVESFAESLCEHHVFTSKIDGAGIHTRYRLRTCTNRSDKMWTAESLDGYNESGILTRPEPDRQPRPNWMDAHQRARSGEAGRPTAPAVGRRVRAPARGVPGWRRRHGRWEVAESGPTVSPMRRVRGARVAPARARRGRTRSWPPGRPGAPGRPRRPPASAAHRHTSGHPARAPGSSSTAAA